MAVRRSIDGAMLVIEAKLRHIKYMYSKGGYWLWRGNTTSGSFLNHITAGVSGHTYWVFT